MYQPMYSKLGKVIDEIARDREVRGPLAISRYVREQTGGGPSQGGWSQILLGKNSISKGNMRRFIEAFECSEEETNRLIRVWLEINGERDFSSPPVAA